MLLYKEKDQEILMIQIKLQCFQIIEYLKFLINYKYQNMMNNYNKKLKKKNKLIMVQRKNQKLELVV